MQDRFKFRCGITISHYDDDGNDIETSLLVNNISIFDDGDVGFNRESLKEAVERKNLSEEEERTLWNSLDEYEVFEDWYQMSADFIEQCTCLEDKNRKLIYDGDILQDCEQKIIVVFDEERHCFMFKYQKTHAYKPISCLDVLDGDFEVIGNIHENRDLIEG